MIYIYISRIKFILCW